MLKIFKRKNKNDNFFGENDNQVKIIGKFIESKNGIIYGEYDITKDNKVFVGAWICEAKARNNDYNIINY